MKTTMTYRILMVLAAAMIAGCVRNNDFGGGNETRRAVRFTAVIDGATPATRTTNGGDAWAAGDKVGIFMLPAGAGGALAANTPYTATNTGDLSPDGDPLHWPEEGTEVRFAAYYPYSVAATDGRLDVLLTNQSDPAAIDMLWARTPSSQRPTRSRADDATVNLDFAHVLSKVTFNVRLNEWASGTPTAVPLGGMPAAATLDITTGILIPGTAANIGALRTAATPGGFVASFTAIITPQSGGAAGRTARFTVGGVTYTWDIPADEAWEAGRHYTYPVTVQAPNPDPGHDPGQDPDPDPDLSVTVGAPTIARWITVDHAPEIPDQILTEYTVTYHANGGEGDAYVQTVKRGNIATIPSAPAAGISRPEYGFVSWNTAEDGNGTTYDPESGITPTADIDLYAVWRYGYVRIFYSGAGESYTNFTTADIELDSQHTVLEIEDTGMYNIFTGYGFAGEWAADDGTTYRPGDVITADRDITLRARWKITEYRIVYYADEVGGGIVDVFSADEPIFLRGSAQDAGIIRPPSPPDTYSSFNWREDVEGGYKIHDLGAEYTPDGTSPVIFMRITWVISMEFIKFIFYNFQASTGDGGQQYVITCRDGDNFTAATLEETGFVSSREFLGWYGDNGKAYQPGDPVPSNEVSNLYAEWGGVTIAPPPGSDDEPIVVSVTYPVVYHDAKGNVIWSDKFADGATHEILHLDNDLNGKIDHEIFLGWATSPDSDEVVYAAKGRFASKQVMEPSTMTITTAGAGVNLYPVTRTGRKVTISWTTRGGDWGMFSVDHKGKELTEGDRRVKLGRPGSDYYWWKLDNWYAEVPATEAERRHVHQYEAWLEVPILSMNLNYIIISLELYDRYPVKRPWMYE